MMNALFGVLGATACRFFDGAIANAITTFGQQTLRWTARRVRGGRLSGALRRHRLGVRQAERRRGRAARRRTRRARCARRSSSASSARVRAEYQRRAPAHARAGARAGALLHAARALAARAAARSATPAGSTARCSIVGLESVRRDWPAVARRLQEGILRRASSTTRIRCRSCARWWPACAPASSTRSWCTRSASARARSTATPRRRRRTSRRRARPGARRGGHPLRDHPRRSRARAAGPPAAGEHRSRRTAVEKILRPIADAILPELGHSFDEAIGEAAPAAATLTFCDDRGTC